MKALVVDDDLALADVVSFTMRRAGFEIIVAHDGQSALERWEAAMPDLVILDLNLPKLDGLTVCKQIRARANTPIIILSVRGDEDDVVNGLKLGADDYIIKPFSPRQLVARAQAVLRRSNGNSATQSCLSMGDMSLDISRREVHFGDRFVAQLTNLENRLLEYLMRNSGQVVLSDTLIDYIWGPGGGDRMMLKQLVYRLRRKIEMDPADPKLLETAPGIGYTLNSQAH
ncbi:MAG: response regulator transcription factor [Anaerolineales bacterium]|nr:response regulator transcription factor [Anaerolineales bacterium]